MEKIKPMVRVPKSLNKVREGRGFSLGELREANLTLHDAKKIGVMVDKRRRSVHKENVEALRKLVDVLKAGKAIKEVSEEEKAVEEAPAEKVEKAKVEQVEVVEEGTPLTILKGLGPKTAEKLKNAGIENLEQLAKSDAKLLSEATGISEKKLASWIEEAKELVKKKK
ncbi:MAG: ribosomal protein L13e [Nitrososphaerota archaeon]